MTSVSACASGSYTFAANEQATISPTQGEACEVEVRRTGALIAGRRITTEMSIGPFAAGDVMRCDSALAEFYVRDGVAKYNSAPAPVVEEPQAEVATEQPKRQRKSKD